ncbi:nucleotide-diphospho-sugar transferase [Jimgerdemannia flammicorona]|uniref:Nucleotide-diphospho-sugar transferase n=1 Tax=Jimgerdemannia flammicorona TaxID=994334 RepID=A0A433DCM6_9FUNG|nr:nucleotide-diphospho-sugar transferase [Jimgerdemannia flammicorona]
MSYSFVIPFRERLGEEEPTHPSLWDTSLQFIDTHPQYRIPQNQSLVNFITQGSKHGGWNLCHFLPGAIEVLDLRFYKSPAYQEFFIAIDEAGGFFYAGWGPEHVRSIGSTLLLPRSAVKWWHEIGVREAGLAYCPSDLETGKARADCICRLEENFERSSKSCLAEFFDL